MHDYDYDFDTAIVGESNYKSTIAKCYKESELVDVTLILEDDNPYDNNAVAVVSKYGVVGYLDRETAKKYRRDSHNQDGAHAKGLIYPPKDGQQHYGIWIDLGYSEAPNKSTLVNKNKSKYIKYILIILIVWLIMSIFD